MEEAIRESMPTVKVPTRHDRVYKDECMFSFDTPESPTGLYTSLTTWQSFGADYVQGDYNRNHNPLYLKQVWKRIVSDPPPPPADGKDPANIPSKMAIGVEGGFDLDSKPCTNHVTNFLVLFPEKSSIQLPSHDLPTVVTASIEAILAHDGFKRTTEVAAAWEEESLKESKYAKDLPHLPNAGKFSADPKTWRCEQSGMTDNLWLNLSTGHIGSGRRNWDGSGGTGAAEAHYEETGKLYPLVVKLGTITAKTADVFSYAADEKDLVVDPFLSQHLAHWGIDMKAQEKSEKTMTELQIELNAKHNFSRITESGSDLVQLHGPAYIGLQNLGNSCYMSSIMQILFSLPEIAKRFYDQADSIFASAPADPSEDLFTMMAKIAVGLLSDRYSKPIPSYEKDAMSDDKLILSSRKIDDEYGNVKPFMFKNVIGKGHMEFSGPRQQDASEFLQHYLDKITRAERVGCRRLLQTGESEDSFVSLGAFFGFELEDRIEDMQTKKVKYMTRTDYVFSLDIDVNDAVNKKQYDEFEEQSKKRPKYEDGVEEMAVHLEIPLSACLERYATAETIENFTSPETGKNGIALKRTRFKTFPEYLTVRLNRYQYDENHMPKKLEASITMPLDLDLSHLRGSGPQDDEVIFDDAITQTTAAPMDVETVVPDAAIVSQLMGMGFSENGSKRAAIATKNASAEASIDWVFSHMEDANFNDAIEVAQLEREAPGNVSSSSVQVDTEAVASLSAMGFTENQSKAALIATNGSLERAADWLFSHDGCLDSTVNDVLAGSHSGNDGNSGNGVCASGSKIGFLDGEGKYELVGFASHLGQNMNCGHYVAHIRKEGRFVLYNDTKVAVSKKPPLDLGFLYIYRRKCIGAV